MVTEICWGLTQGGEVRLERCRKGTFEQQRQSLPQWRSSYPITVHPGVTSQTFTVCAFYVPKLHSWADYKVVKRNRILSYVKHIQSLQMISLLDTLTLAYVIFFILWEMFAKQAIITICFETMGSKSQPSEWCTACLQGASLPLSSMECHSGQPK